PAAVRGGSQPEAKPRAKSPPSPKRGRAAPRRPQGAPAAGDVATGLSSRLVLVAAAGALTLAMVGVLATGGRAEKLGQAVNAGVGAAFAKGGFRLATVHVQGASAMATADIVRAAGLYRNQPLIGLNLEALR